MLTQKQLFKLEITCLRGYRDVSKVLTASILTVTEGKTFQDITLTFEECPTKSKTHVYI